MTANSVLIESVGFVASALVFAAFFMKTIIPLRVIAVLSNFAFAGYGYFTGSLPVLLLHLALLPLNAIRLHQQIELIRDVRQADLGDHNLDWFGSLATPKFFPSGTQIFRQGDHADALYLLEEGSVRLSEINVVLNPGEMFGEIGLFTEQTERTASAVAQTDCKVLLLSYHRALEAYFQNPKFGLYVVRLITSRLLENAKKT